MELTVFNSATQTLTRMNEVNSVNEEQSSETGCLTKTGEKGFCLLQTKTGAVNREFRLIFLYFNLNLLRAL